MGPALGPKHGVHFGVQIFTLTCGPKLGPYILTARM